MSQIKGKQPANPLFNFLYLPPFGTHVKSPNKPRGPQMGPPKRASNTGVHIKRASPHTLAVKPKSWGHQPCHPTTDTDPLLLGSFLLTLINYLILVLNLKGHIWNLASKFIWTYEFYICYFL